MLSLCRQRDGQMDWHTDRWTGIRTEVKQYANDLLIRGIKRKKKQADGQIDHVNQNMTSARWLKAIRAKNTTTQQHDKFCTFFETFLQLVI